MSSDPDILDTVKEAARNTGLEPDTIDVPLPEIEEHLGDQGPITDSDLGRVGPDELIKAVMKRGSVMFSEGRMLTKCPAYNSPAVCGMYPLPHPSTGEPIMVCTGPVVMQDTKVRLFGENEDYLTVKSCHYSCPYSPERINEAPEHSGQEDSSTEGWL